MPEHAEVVICGAGIAGVAAAYELQRRGLQNILLVDERAPLSLTSDKSTECYRNWWPGPDGAMVALMNRSIDLLEDLARASGNAFLLNRRGYLYVSADPQRIDTFTRLATQTEAYGAGPFRVHQKGSGAEAYQPAHPEHFEDQPSGVDLILDRSLIEAHFSYLSPKVEALLHVRRAGWFSAQQLGALLLASARAGGVELCQGRVEAIEQRSGILRSVSIASRDGLRRIESSHFINAAGPHLQTVASMLGVELRLRNELHTKVSMADPLGAMPRQAPLLIWADPQRLNWSAEEAAYLSQSQETAWFLETLPEGAHGRPEGHGDSPIMLLLWDYHNQVQQPSYPLSFDPEFPELALRGMCTMLPGLEPYLARLPRPHMDGGYYTKTPENRPLIGPLGAEGAWVLGALSGFGLMAAPAAAELLALQLTGAEPPHYAGAFWLERYADPAYQAQLENWGPGSQL